ncbi:uncharacterized protein [Dermacentor andersoni]|uniref:uncharacterized protein n=1 Tax=Dermacentor andersoni TaxID=34620 RepID=UPI003B3BBEFF
MPGCCVPQCSNHSRNGWRMFHFPRDPKRRLLWLVRVKRDKWQPTNSSCVCSAHFEASSFEQNRADGWKKLKPNAVPTVFPFKELPKERRPPRERNAHVPALFSDDAAAHNSSREVRNVLPSTTQEFSPADSSSDGEINERLAATETNNANGQLTSTPRDARLQETAIVTATQPLDSEAAELRKKIADLTAANNKLRQHHNESKNTVKKLQMQVRKLQKEATNFSRNTKFLNEDQIRALSRNNNHGNSWSAQTVKQGLKIKFACGTTGYETLRKIGYPLPSSRTLARRIQGLKFLPGILHEVIDVMRSKAEGMEDVEKDCVLFLDEMEIAPGFELDRGEDVLLGGTTLPSKPEEPANHALVFMLGGVNQRWKQVIAYEFTGRHVDGSVLKAYVLEIVQICSQISLRVRVITCDMGAANRAMWREFGFSSHRHSTTSCSIPHPTLKGKELFFISDPAHVLKNLKGQLLSSKVFTLSDTTVSRNGLTASKVKLEHVQAVLDYDAANELKVAPNLSETHISCGHFTKMKVGVAVQLFREAPPAIRFLIKEGVIEPEAETTAWFMDLVSRWYALMSSRHPTMALSRRNITKYHAALDTLRTATDTIRELKMGTGSQWKPSQAGVLIATTAVLRLQEVLLGSEGYEFLLTSRLLQDCLENLFSVVRLMKPVPTAYDLKCALRLVSVSHFLHTPRSTSYELDDREYLVDLLAHSKKECAESEVDEINDTEILFIEELTSTECRILFYLGGFILKGILKSITCPQCKAALLGKPDDQYASLTALKEYVRDGQNLVYPSADVMKTLKNYEEHFTAVNSWCTGKFFTMKSPLRSLIAYLEGIDKPSVNTCMAHKERISKMLTAAYARVRLRIHLRQIPSTHPSGHGSKTCAGVSLA